MTKDKDKDKEENLRFRMQRIKYSNPKLYEKIIELRQEHECLMSLLPEHVARLQETAVNKLIEYGHCKRMVMREKVYEIRQKQ